MSSKTVGAVVVFVGLIGLVAVANRSLARGDAASGQAVIRYGVLITEFSMPDALTPDQAASVEIRATWRSTERQPLVGNSTVSEGEAFRALISRLGGNPNQSDLAGLLNTLGRRGWQLVESETIGTRTVRIFRLN